MTILFHFTFSSMKRLRIMKRPVAVALLSLSLFQFSARSAVAVGSYHNAPAVPASASHNMESALGWAAIGAGVAVVGAAVGAVVGAYEIGTIVGRAAYDVFGRNSVELSASFERNSYVANDFSEFDHPSQI